MRINLSRLLGLNNTPKENLQQMKTKKVYPEPAADARIKKNGILVSEKIDVQIIQDVIDLMLEAGDNYVHDLQLLNKKYVKSIVKHKREARMTTIPVDHLSIEKTTHPNSEEIQDNKQ